jgi:hypothetical protein
MALNHSEVDNLYSDSSLGVYRPEAVIAETIEGSFVPALCFNLVELPKPEERNVGYAAKLRELAHRLGLPPNYVNSI